MEKQAQIIQKWRSQLKCYSYPLVSLLFQKGFNTYCYKRFHKQLIREKHVLTKDEPLEIINNQTGELKTLYIYNLVV